MDINALVKRCIYLLKISRKPTKLEYDEIIKVAGIGILFMGVLGLLISLIFII